MSNKIVCSLQAIKSEQAALAKLTPEQKELRKSCCDTDSSKFFLKDDDPMPLLYRKAGFSQYQTPSGYVMYRTPCGTKVNPGGSKCRGFLSAILESRPDLKPLSDSVKTASPPRKKPDVLAHKLRSSKDVDQPATPSMPPHHPVLPRAQWNLPHCRLKVRTPTVTFDNWARRINSLPFATPQKWTSF